jgi:hypothetical protein
MTDENERRLGKWRRFRNRSPEDRSLILSAALFLPLTQLGFRLLGFRRWKEFIEQFLPSVNASDPLPAVTQAVMARHMARAVRSGELHGPATPNCLVRSTVLWWFLRRRGIDGELHIGARKNGTSFEAHAWVELGGQVLNDTPEVHHHYSRFDAPIAAAESDPSFHIEEKIDAIKTEPR